MRMLLVLMKILMAFFYFKEKKYKIKESRYI